MSAQTPSQAMLIMPETLRGQYIEGSDELSASQPFFSALASDIPNLGLLTFCGIFCHCESREAIAETRRLLHDLRNDIF